MIVGKWTMQKQIITQYVDGVKQSDSTLTVSNKVMSYVQFDKNGSFTSASQYNSEGIGSTSLSAVIGVDSISGTYSFSGTVFNLSAAALGGLSAPTVIGVSSGSIPVIHLVSQSAQIMQLTSSTFTLHTEYTTTQTIAADTKTYKNVQENYYTK
jgi:hypothetical protein